MQVAENLQNPWISTTSAKVPSDLRTSLRFFLRTGAIRKQAVSRVAAGGFPADFGLKENEDI